MWDKLDAYAIGIMTFNKYSSDRLIRGIFIRTGLR